MATVQMWRRIQKKSYFIASGFAARETRTGVALWTSVIKASDLVTPAARLIKCEGEICTQTQSRIANPFLVTKDKDIYE